VGYSYLTFKNSASVTITLDEIAHILDDFTYAKNSGQLDRNNRTTFNGRVYLSFKNIWYMKRGNHHIPQVQNIQGETALVRKLNFRWKLQPQNHY